MNDKLTVLLIEDNPGDARLVRELLVSTAPVTFDLVHVDRLAAGLTRLAAGGIDVVLLDLSLPDSHGPDTLIRARSHAADTPIVVMTSLDDEALGIRLLHEGAQDYLVKGQADGPLLTRTIRYAIERKRAEQDLAAERHLLRTLIDNLPDAIYVKDAAGRFTVVNSWLAALMGMAAPEAMLGKTDFDLYPPELAARFQADEQEIIRTGQPLIDREEPLLNRVTGRQGWHSTTKAPLRDASGRIVGLVGVSRDVSERVHAQEALRRSARRLALLHAIDQATLAQQPIAAIAALAVQGVSKLVSCSRADVALLDAATGAFTVLAVQGPAATGLGPGARFPIPAPIVAQLQRGEAHGVADLDALPDLPPKLRLLRAAGVRSFVGVPMAVQGELTGLLSLAADRPAAFSAEDLEIISEIADQLAVAIRQARLTGQVQRHAAELEQRVADRTAELTQREAALREANARLMELDRFKSQFVSDVSHELRQPLTNIKAYLYLLDRGRPERRAGYMETLHRETDLLQHLIEDLLQLSRLDLNKVQPAVAALDLSRLVSTLAHDRAPLAAEHGLALQTLLAADLPPVQADAKMLTQVLTNLLANALNYTPRGGAITVSTAETQGSGGAGEWGSEGAGEQGSGGAGEQGSGGAGATRTTHHAIRNTQWVTCSVADTGPGIAAEEQVHIFERFYRGEAAHQSGAPGTGLGLAICQELVALHKGRITVASRLGEGSTFTVWLPK